MGVVWDGVGAQPVSKRSLTREKNKQARPKQNKTTTATAQRQIVRLTDNKEIS